MPGLVFLFLIGKNLDLFSPYVYVFLFYECAFADMNVFILSVCLVLRGQEGIRSFRITVTDGGEQP